MGCSLFWVTLKMIASFLGSPARTQQYIVSSEIVRVKSFIMISVSRRSVSRVGWIRLCVIAPTNAAPFEETLQRWQTVGNTASGLIGPRFRTSLFKEERVTA